MIYRSRFILKSYVKTTVACLLLVPAVLLFAFFDFRWFPNAFGSIVAAIDLVIALGAAMLACAGAIVLIRYKRWKGGERDLFLELNRSRDATAIESAATIKRTTRIRRWLAKRLLGHDLVVGDLVEIKSWPEIRSTLDEQGCLGALPFMPEMLAMCGQRAYVFRCAHRLFDYRKTRRMRHMDGTVLLVGAICSGASHGGCEAACHTIWKAAWIRRIERGSSALNAKNAPNRSNPTGDFAILRFGTQAPRYICQLTQLHTASQPIGNWSAINFLRPLIAGNVTLAAFVVGWMTHLFNEIQHLRRGVTFPSFEKASLEVRVAEENRFMAGDHIVVRTPSEIRATLNDQFSNRGLWLEPDMLKHCGRRYSVQAEVSRLIDIVSGEMRTMKTPAYILRDIHFSGERQQFNAQYEPLFWRGAWLRRDGD